MASKLSFTALTGSGDEGPISYLLQLDDINILLDCGSIKEFKDEFQEKEYNRLTSNLDLILLTHPTLTHIGGYPNLYHRLTNQMTTDQIIKEEGKEEVVQEEEEGKEVKQEKKEEEIKIKDTQTKQMPLVYGTIPLQNMGRMCMLDQLYAYQYENLSNTKLNNNNNNDDDDNNSWLNSSIINKSFDHITSLRYSQPTALSGKCQGITIVAYGAGHTIGGTIWQIKKATDVIVYAPDFNHRKEKHLNGSVLLSGGLVLDSLFRPSLLIAGAYNGLSVQTSRKILDASLLAQLQHTLQKSGTVLMPTDSSSRILELAFVLEQSWQNNADGLTKYPIYMVSYTGLGTMKYAKSMLEWMGGHIAEEFGNTRENPFEFKFIKVINNLNQLPSGPKVVLASSMDLQWGHSKRILSDLWSDPKNCIILTSKGLPDTIARDLFDGLSKGDGESKDIANDILIDEKFKIKMELNVIERVPLQGSDLIEYRNQERVLQEKAAEQMALQASNRHLVDDSESDSEDGMVGDNPNITDPSSILLNQQFDLYLKESDNRNNSLLFRSLPQFKLFPLIERKRKFDSYGETIQPNNFVTELDKALLAKTQFIGVEENDENELELKVKEKPYKLMNKLISVNGTIKLMYFGLEGRSDSRSINTIFTKLAPRKLILIHGSESSRLNLKQSYLTNRINPKSKVFLPEKMNTLLIAQATHHYQIELHQNLLNSIKFSEYNDYQIARLDSKVELIDKDLPNLQLTSLKRKKFKDSLMTSKKFKPIMIGEVKLAELKTLLMNLNVDPKFELDGSILCRNNVRISKTDTGGLKLEGPPVKEYFIVRNLVYNSHAIL